MTPELFYWKPITSEAGLPKEEPFSLIKYDNDHIAQKQPREIKMIDRWARKATHYACPLPPAGEEMKKWLYDNLGDRSVEYADSLKAAKKRANIGEVYFIGGVTSASLLLPILAAKDREIERLKSKLEAANTFINVCKITEGTPFTDNFLKPK